MTWWLHAQIGRESICYPLDEQAADLGPTAGEGLDFDDSASATPPWSGGGLEFSLVGDGPSFDLGVADPVGGASLVVTDADITMATFCYVASLDCALLVEGDPGTTISRSVILLPMAKVRQGLAGGKDEISVEIGRAHV